MSLLSPLYFGLISLHHALSYPYIIQDDARQHIVWLQQFVDPELFPNDLIANYFRTVAPSGYQFFYWGLSQLGLEPIVVAKFLPIGLGLIATGYLFQVSLLILPIPFTAWLSTVLLNQQLWLNDDLISATPRAFVYPIFAAFLYYLLRSSLVPCLITILLQGLFFPQFVLLQIAILTVRLVEWRDRSIRFTQTRKSYLLWGCGLVVAGGVLLPFAMRLSDFGPVITAAQMRSMPEYNGGGRNQYFGVNLFQWIFDSSSGLEIPLFPAIVWLGFALPFLRRSSLVVPQITDHIRVLWQVLVASLSMFSLASLLLLKLHFPSRYTYHTWRFLLPIATSIVLTILLASGWRWLQRHRIQREQFSFRELALIGIVGLLIITVTVVPAIPHLFFKFQGWHIGNTPDLYAYLSQQPKDTLVASLAPEAENLPAFAQRSTFVGREFALPHHPAYYQQIQQRMTDMIRLQYSPSLSEVQQIIETNGIDFLLIEAQSFSPEYLRQDWLIHSSIRNIVQETIAQLEQGMVPALTQTIERCSVLATQELALLDARCVSRF
jgi:uncharacterized membrane protein YidH (DUF202 family)